MHTLGEETDVVGAAEPPTPPVGAICTDSCAPSQLGVAVNTNLDELDDNGQLKEDCIADELPNLLVQPIGVIT